MQYDLGDTPLEDPPVEPKKSLDPEEERKLSGDMREFYDRLKPTADSIKRREGVVKSVERILHKEWPGTEFTVHVFGSSGNMLCTSDSDG
jgi:DNA polymerase sigma